MSARRLPLRSRLARGYAAVLLVSGAVLLAGAYVIVARASARYDRAVTARVAQQLDQRRAHMFPGAPGAPRGVPAPGEARAQRRATVAAQRSALPTYRREIALEFAGLLGLVTVSSLGVGRLLAARALGPVRDITRAAQGIGEEDLDRRLGAEGPDDELTELARTLSGMLDRIRAAVEAQRAFAGHASHELRTPLSIIRAEIDACRDGEATSACGGSKEPADSPAHKTLAPLPRAGPGGPRGAQPVGFRASDGVGIPGRLFGQATRPWCSPTWAMQPATSPTGIRSRGGSRARGTWC